MRVDLNCPAEIAAVEIRREEDCVRLILMDLADRPIDSCEATVRIRNREGEEIAREVHRARALRGRPHIAFSMTVPMEIPEGAESAEATLDKVWFEDRDVWRRSPAAEKEYESNRLEPGNELNALRYVAGEGAVGFPSQQADLWVCVCGRPNGNGETVCARCRRQREMIFRQYSRGAVLSRVSQRERQLDLETRGAREETARLQRLREEEYNRKREIRRKWRRGLLTAAALLALAAGIYWGGLPAWRLYTADRAMQEDRLEEARETLTALGGFPGAEERLAETERRILRRDGAMAAENPEAFPGEEAARLAAALRETGEEADSALADRVDLARAGAILKAGEAEAAEALASGLPEGLSGREQLILDCRYARGEAALAANEHARAREIFEALGDYPGAAEKAKEARYEGALADLEEGKYDEAAEAFASLGDYQDSRELIPRCHYLKGVTLEEAGEAEAARLAYLEAGEHQDAPARAAAIRWSQAEAALAAEDYEAALPLYREMDGYEDARDKWIQCATELARKAYREREYTAAAAWLEDLPEDTRTTRQIRTRAYYLGAKAAANRGETEKAIEMMEKVSDYGDARKNIRNWRIALAKEKADAGQYAEALEILAPVAENYQAGQLIKEIEKKAAETDP